MASEPTPCIFVFTLVGWRIQKIILYKLYHLYHTQYQRVCAHALEFLVLALSSALSKHFFCISLLFV